MPDRRPPPSECANCGAALPRTARACPECGADERTGWREASLYDGLDLPDSAWSDEGGHASKGPGKAARRVNGVPWYWWVAGVLLLLCFLVGGFGMR